MWVASTHTHTRMHIMARVISAFPKVRRFTASMQPPHSHTQRSSKGLPVKHFKPAGYI